MNKKDMVELESMTSELNRMKKRLYRAAKDIQGYANAKKEIKHDISSLKDVHAHLLKSVMDMDALYINIKSDVSRIQYNIAMEHKKALTDIKAGKKAKLEAHKILIVARRKIKSAFLLKDKYSVKISELSKAQQAVASLKKQLEKELTEQVNIRKNLKSLEELAMKRKQSMDARDKKQNEREGSLDDREKDYERRQRVQKDKEEAFRIEKNRFYENKK